MHTKFHVLQYVNVHEMKQHWNPFQSFSPIFPRTGNVFESHPVINSYAMTTTPTDFDIMINCMRIQKLGNELQKNPNRNCSTLQTSRQHVLC